MTLDTIIAVGVVSMGCLVVAFRQSRRDSLPPGPRRLPLLGSIFEVPITYQWIKFSEWGKRYGNLVYFEVLGRPYVVLNTAKAAKDLLDHRSSTYSDRPQFEMANLSGYDRTFVLQPMNEIWRQQRKIVSQELAPRTIRRYHAFQEAEAQALVKGIVNDSSDLEGLLKLRIGTIICRITYGHYISSADDPFLTLGINTMTNFCRSISPGSWLVDNMSILKHVPKWMPGSGFLTQASQWRHEALVAAWDPYKWATDHLESGTTLLPNLCASVLTALNEIPSDKQQEQHAWSASTMMGGGMDTSVISALNFFLEMIRHPDVQAKAQEEIDRVIGRDRLPVIQDRESLPYVRSIITEVLRMNPALPLAIPHALNQDDVYEGMYLPKDSTIVANIWMMLHDPDVFMNPMEFDPARYLNSDSEMAKVTEVVFGFGRRVCPGKLFGEATLFAVVATTLATCNILPPVDAGGNKVAPSVTFSGGTFSSPSKFDFVMQYRSDHSREMLSDVPPGNEVNIGSLIPV